MSGSKKKQNESFDYKKLTPALDQSSEYSIRIVPISNKISLSKKQR